MSLDLRIQTFLRSSAVGKINFRFKRLSVTRAGFLALSNHFSNGYVANRIRVTVRPILIHRNSLAEYSAAKDKLLLRSPNAMDTDIGRAVVLHECTHAQMDLRRLHGTVTRTEEAAAHIAEALYLLAVGASTNSLPPAIVSIAAGIETQAATGAIAVVPTSQHAAALAAMAHAGYPTGSYNNDGIGSSRGFTDP